LTARRGEQLLGCCVGNIEPYFTGNYFYLKEMFVSPDAQQQGIGAALMDTLKTRLAEAGVRTMILFTGKDFYPFDFYLKSGFQEMEGMRMMHYEG
jgi:predicted N-acetyltransferase YhbS